jgi:hypothetical protein
VPADALDRTEGLLALILLSLNDGKSLKQKALLLKSAGFSNVETANLLGTTAQHIAQALYEVRRDGAKKSRKKRR